MFHKSQKVDFRWHSGNGNHEALLTKLRDVLNSHVMWVVIRPNMGEDIAQPDVTTTVYLRPAGADVAVNMGEDPEGIDGYYVSVNTNHGLIAFGFGSLNYMRVKIYDDDSIELAEGNYGSPEPTRVAYFVPQN